MTSTCPASVAPHGVGSAAALTPGPSPACARGENTDRSEFTDGLLPSPACGRGAGGEGSAPRKLYSPQSPRLHRLPRLAPLALALLLAACRVDLYGSLNETEANQMLAALTSEGIDADKVHAGESGWTVRVDEAQLPAALEVLRSEGLPGERFASLGQVFQKQGLVATPTEERMRYIFALSQELSETLRNIDGVVTARVHVVIPATDPLSDKVRPSSAAVFIKHRPDTDLRLLVPTVKDMVAHSIEGVTHDNVSLSLVEARPYTPLAPIAHTPAASGFPVGRFVAIAAAVVVAIALAGLGALAWKRGGLRQALGWLGTRTSARSRG